MQDPAKLASVFASQLSESTMHGRTTLYHTVNPYEGFRSVMSQCQHWPAVFSSPFL